MPRTLAPANVSTLVLYDTTGPYGFLGELYGMATANLAGHFGTVKTLPVSSYTAGMMNSHAAVIYIGSTYYGGSIPDAIPAAFYADVTTSTKPVIWLNDNVWNLAHATAPTQPGQSGPQAFAAKYGWDPTNSYFESGGSIGQVTSVSYKGQTLKRSVPPAGDSGVLRPLITNSALVNVLATATDSSTGAMFPWAIRSGNLTYIGEIPFQYTNESDRLIAFSDLLFDSLAPNTQQRHRAMVRLEDIHPNYDPDELRAVAEYLAAANIPYSFGVIPVYKDPKGVEHNGRNTTIRMYQRPRLVSVLKYMIAHGGTMIVHGYTHQYSNVDNPYNGVSGDDFEFFRAHVDANNFVIYDGPVAEDSQAWASNRMMQAKLELMLAGLPVPKIWEFPHYAASYFDYRAVPTQGFTHRYERALYFKGSMGGNPEPNRFIGQFFPYVVKDVYGQTVLPENIGNYEPEEFNNHPPRFPADMIASARLNLAVRDGFASFFYHPYLGVSALKETVDGIRALGYTFVSPSQALQ